jgi:valyl-tRNA synthetase
VDALLSAPTALLPLLEAERGVIENLAKVNLKALGVDLAAPKGAAAELAGQVQVFLPLEGLVDLGVERERLKKEKGRLEGLLQAQRNKLANEAFVSKAPVKLVEAERAKLAELEQALAKLSASLAELGV